MNDLVTLYAVSFLNKCECIHQYHENTSKKYYLFHFSLFLIFFGKTFGLLRSVRAVGFLPLSSSSSHIPHFISALRLVAWTHEFVLWIQVLACVRLDSHMVCAVILIAPLVALLYRSHFVYLLNNRSISSFALSLRPSAGRYSITPTVVFLLTVVQVPFVTCNIFSLRILIC